MWHTKKEGGGSESTGLGHTIACAWGVILLRIILIIPNKITFWPICTPKQAENVTLNLYKMAFVQIFGLNLSRFGAVRRAIGDVFLYRFVQIFWVLTPWPISCRL